MSGGGPPKVEHLELRLIQNTDIIKSPPPISELFLWLILALQSLLNWPWVF